MRHIRCLGIAMLLFAILLSGCSAEAVAKKGADLLDKMFSGDSSPTTTAAKQAPSTSSDFAGQEPDGAHFPEAVEPSIPEHPAASTAQEPVPTEAEPSTPAQNVTPSHTDATFFGPGESFKYLPKGADGVYACTYASEDESVATVDQDTGKVTAVGPGTTKVSMHVECNGQYDFECIVRCNWDDIEKEPSLPPESSEPSLPADVKTAVDIPAPSAGTITASHADATFFNPKEHFKFLPVGADSGYTCSYTTDDENIASVDEKGTVTAVGPGTTTVTMTVDGGGTEYIFKCIVRCNFEPTSTKS